MQGIMTFRSLAAAARAGFDVYDRTETGYLVRKGTTARWALAIVVSAEACQGRSVRPVYEDARALGRRDETL